MNPWVQWLRTNAQSRHQLATKAGWDGFVNAAPRTDLELLSRAELAALGVEDHCEFCSITFVVPAARACADAGDLPAAERYLEIAERSVNRWEGTAWRAALEEARAHLATARGDGEAAGQSWGLAAQLFEVAGQPLDARRCRDREPVVA